MYLTPLPPPPVPLCSVRQAGSAGPWIIASCAGAAALQPLHLSHCAGMITASLPGPRGAPRTPPISTSSVVSVQRF